MADRMPIDRVMCPMQWAMPAARRRRGGAHAPTDFCRRRLTPGAEGGGAATLRATAKMAAALEASAA